MKDKFGQSSSTVMMRTRLVPCWHVLNLFVQCSPVLGLKLCILDSLLAPVLMKLADVILRLLEIQQLVTDAFFYEYTPRMLIYNRLLVLHEISIRSERKRHSTYGSDGLLELLLLPWLCSGTLWSSHQHSELVLVALYSSL